MLLSDFPCGASAPAAVTPMFISTPKVYKQAVTASIMINARLIFEAMLAPEVA